MTEESPQYLDIQPKALRLADEVDEVALTYPDMAEVPVELRRLHAENQALQTGYNAARLEIESLQARLQEVGNAARENRSRAVVELEVQLAASDKARRDAEFASECYRKDIEVLIAPLRAEWYDSKDWREGSRLVRIEWLLSGYEGGKAEIERLTADVLSLQAQLDAVGAGGVEPLRRAKCLHQIAEPVRQEPVAWRTEWAHPHAGIYQVTDIGLQAEAWEKQGRKVEPLYMAPQPPAPVRKPLTGEQIKDFYGDNSSFDLVGPYIIAFARAIEAAHGIGQKVGAA